MLRLARALVLAWPLFALAAPAPISATAAAAEPGVDPIQREIDRFQERIATTEPSDEELKSAHESATPLLALSERALADGKRWFALTRLAFVWSNLEAADYRAGYPTELRSQMSALESELARFEPERARFASAGRPSLDETPAAARAIAEVAFSELDGFTNASLDYGKATAADIGLYYIGAARAQISLARFVAGLRDPGATARPLAPRSLAVEIATVEDELLAAYVPPASVEQHSVFIRISSLLKQAHELDAAGLRHGALYKLLDAKMRLARMAHPERKMSSAEAIQRAEALEPKLRATGVDSTLAQTFVEIALVQSAESDPAMLGPETAAAVFEEVSPLYTEVLGSAPATPSEQAAEVTVTIQQVCWLRAW
jgi:hypothetical protein